MATKLDLDFELKTYRMCFNMQLEEFKHDFRHIVFHEYLTDEQKIVSLKMLLEEENAN